MRQKKYLIFILIILFMEIFIGFFIHDKFFRPYFGDFLAVLFVYFLLRYFSRLNIIWSAVLSLSLAYIIELGQYFNLSTKLGLENSTLIVKATIGNSFDLKDIIAYSIAILLVFALEKYFRLQNSNN